MSWPCRRSLSASPSPYEDWLNANLGLFDLLVVGRETARCYAEIRRELKAAGRPVPSNDAWIAALGREHRRPVVSRSRGVVGAC